MTRLTRAAMLSPLFLTLVLLTSCATPGPTSPKSSSVIVRETAADAGKLYCSALKPEPIPLTAPVEWINHAARAAEKWLTMCKPD